MSHPHRLGVCSNDAHPPPGRLCGCRSRQRLNDELNWIESPPGSVRAPVLAGLSPLLPHLSTRFAAPDASNLSAAILVGTGGTCHRIWQSGSPDLQTASGNELPLGRRRFVGPSFISSGLVSRARMCQWRLWVLRGEWNSSRFRARPAEDVFLPSRRRYGSGVCDSLVVSLRPRQPSLVKIDCGVAKEGCLEGAGSSRCAVISAGKREPDARRCGVAGGLDKDLRRRARVRSKAAREDKRKLQGGGRGTWGPWLRRLRVNLARPSSVARAERTSAISTDPSPSLPYCGTLGCSGSRHARLGPLPWPVRKADKEAHATRRKQQQHCAARRQSRECR